MANGSNGTIAEAVLRPAKLDAKLLNDLQRVATLRHLGMDQLHLLQGAERVELPKRGHLPVHDDGRYGFYAVFEGVISISKDEGRNDVHLLTSRAGESFGEVPLLSGWRPVGARCVALERSQLLRIPEQSFWNLMAASPLTREAILKDYGHRFEFYQAMALHREKLISLGTLAAGLMHELNNPGAAARRAAAQLREHISRLQPISLRLTRPEFAPAQPECLARLQEQIMAVHKPVAYSSLEQSDREEELAAWLETASVENAWRLAPTMVSVGWSHDDIACAHDTFPPGSFSDALNYLDALISSMQHVGTIEESITRVTDLVVAVKKYAYDDKSRKQTIDVRDTLLSTLTILGHKFRQKGIRVERELPPAEAMISCVGVGLTQVWTNLLDNAIDAVPENGVIHVRLWTEPDSVCVGIRDNGPGISPEHREHIFEPFYTTKEAGVGTGLGLDIAHRIVVGNFHGDIQFTSEPGGGAEFLVRLPLAAEGSSEEQGCSIS